MVQFNLPFFAVIVLFPTELLSIFGSTFAAGARALVLLGAAELVNAGTGICGSIIDMAGHTRVKMVNSVLWFGVVLGTDFLLIPEYGLLGAAAASLISTAFINVLRVAEVAILDRVHPYDWSLVKPAVAGAVAIGGGWLIRNAWEPATLAVTGVQIVAVVGLYSVALMAIGLAPEDRELIARAGAKARSFAGRRRGRS
jgi:O-antigen/teichoic acid export membrane protein